MNDKFEEWKKSGSDFLAAFELQVEKYFKPVGIELQISNSEFHYEINVSRKILLTFHAAWSDESIKQCVKLLNGLKDLKNPPRVHILNIDIFEMNEVEEFLGQESKGFGEAALFDNSKRILTMLKPKIEFDQFLSDLKTIYNSN